MLVLLISFSFPYVVKSFSIKRKVLEEIPVFYSEMTDDSLKVKKQYKKAIKRYSDDIIDLNTADTNQLKQIRGIASWSALKIVRYREQLGGFYSRNQLLDLKLKGLSKSTIYKQFVIDTSLVKKFNLDTISFRNLLRHPYFDYKTVKKIFKIKNEYRGLTPEFLLKERAIDTSLYFKIRPYCIN
jgi:predicted DNA-binding helix-hairpin-helix protein